MRAFREQDDGATFRGLNDNFDRLQTRSFHIELFNPGWIPRYPALLPPPNGCPMQHHTGAAHFRSEAGLIETEKAPNSSRRGLVENCRRGAWPPTLPLPLHPPCAA